LLLAGMLARLHWRERRAAFPLDDDTPDSALNLEDAQP
jgi:hypothetical protein